MDAEVKREKMDVAIRTLLPADVPSVTEILRGAPEAANWLGESFEEALNCTGGLGLVSEAEGKMSGFLFGRQVGDEAEVLNLAVTSSRRQLGEGGALLNAALAAFRVSGVSRVFLEVRESNAAAIAFYAKYGFARTGRRPGYYRAPVEAAIVMEKKLTG
jgi:ribosomal-protein-alanine N-acetyltransferase